MVGIWLFHDTCISGIFIKQYTCMISNYQSIKNWNNFDIKNYTCGTCFDCRRKGRLLLQCYQRCCCHQSCSPWTSPRVLIDSPVTFIAITWDLNYLVLILINTAVWLLWTLFLADLVTEVFLIYRETNHRGVRAVPPGRGMLIRKS